MHTYSYLRHIPVVGVAIDTALLGCVYIRPLNIDHTFGLHVITVYSGESVLVCVLVYIYVYG